MLELQTEEIKLRPGQERHNVTDLLKEVYDDNSGLDGCPECDQSLGLNYKRQPVTVSLARRRTCRWFKRHDHSPVATTRASKTTFQCR